MNSAINPTQQTPPPWERLSNETAKAFAAFCVYRDLPPSRRSLDEAGRLIYGTQAGRKRGATGRLREWAKAHEWASRVAAWDAHCDRASCQARVDAVRELQQKHETILARVSDKIADSLVGNVDWDSMTPPQAMKVLSELIQLQRLVVGEPIKGESVEHIADPSTDGSPDWAGLMTPEYMAQVTKILMDCEPYEESSQEAGEVAATG
jgi:hypothetical protein